MDDYTDDDSHAAWQQQQEELRRHAEDEHARYVAANPLWDKCIKHPERPRHEHYHYCAECMDNAFAAYADPKQQVVFGHTYREIGAEQTGYNGEPYFNQERM